MQDDYETIMQWVMLLPEVNDEVLKAREMVVIHLREAEDLERQARTKRASADYAAKVLESMVRRAGWTEEEIATAKAKAHA